MTDIELKFGKTWYNTLQENNYAIMWEEQFIGYLAPYLRENPDGNNYKIAKGDDGIIIIGNVDKELPEAVASILKQ